MVQPKDCTCISTVDPLVALEKFLLCLKDLRLSLDAFYVNANINAPLVTKMGVRGKMSFGLYSRILWSRNNPGVVFDVGSTLHVNGLKDIYLRYGNDWREDKLLREIDLGLYIT